MPAKPLALRYRRRLWQTLRTVEKVAAGKVKGAVWDQTSFGHFIRDASGHACGTAHCFAGWAAENARQVNPDYAYATKANTSINDWAIAYLGLNPNGANGLFVCDNTLDDLRRLVREFAGPEPKAGRR
jgi:hypothetical protein